MSAQSTTPTTGTPQARAKEISVLVPVTERPHPLDRLYEEFAPPLREAGFRFEFLFIVEPANVGFIEALKRLQDAGEPIRVASVGYPAGDTTLLRVGEEQARYDILVSLPVYPRIVASELPKVIQPVLDGAAMSVARRWPRQDSWLNRLQNRIFHFLIRSVGGRRLHDVACGVRAVVREALEELPLYGTFHRFLPLLAIRAGYQVEEVDAMQHPGDRQPRVYWPTRYLSRILDVFGLFFLVRFTDRPLRFFGSMGVIASTVGGMILAILALQRIEGQPLANRPMLLFGAILIVLGVQAIALGLVGEIIVHMNAPQRRPYRLKSGSTAEGPDRTRDRA
jgi:hypothetical protein